MKKHKKCKKQSIKRQIMLTIIPKTNIGKIMEDLIGKDQMTTITITTIRKTIRPNKIRIHITKEMMTKNMITLIPKMIRRMTRKMITPTLKTTKRMIKIMIRMMINHIQREGMTRRITKMMMMMIRTRTITINTIKKIKIRKMMTNGKIKTKVVIVMEVDMIVQL